jgi:hypothetical protein
MLSKCVQLTLIDSCSFIFTSRDLGLLLNHLQIVYDISTTFDSVLVLPYGLVNEFVRLGLTHFSRSHLESFTVTWWVRMVCSSPGMLARGYGWLRYVPGCALALLVLICVVSS